MANIRFLGKDGQSLDGATVCRRFFEVAATSGIKPDHASAVWHDAMHGDFLARDLIEDICDIEIANSDAGFGFV